MSPLSRRNFLAQTAVAAGAAAVVGQHAGAPASAASADTASATAGASTGWWGETSVASEPFVVYIRDAAKGEVAVLSDEQEVVYVDRALVGRLQRAVRRATR